MNINRRLSVLFFIFFLYAAMPSYGASQAGVQTNEANELGVPTQRQVELIRAVLRVDGELTPEMHAEFWVDFKALSRTDSKFLSADIKKSAPALLKYQKALWQSAKLSLAAAKVIRSKELEDAWVELQQVSPDEDGKASTQAKSFLEAAASGKPQKRGNDEILITEELIDHVVAGIDKSLERLINLIDPDWVPKGEL
jgi:hypothetical protein